LILRYKDNKNQPTYQIFLCFSYVELRFKRKKLEQQAAENTRAENAELLLVQMQQIRNELNEAYRQMQLAQKSIAAAEENLKISQDNYNAGVTTISDLLEAQNLLQQSADQHAEAITQYYMKLAEWKKVNGIE
jgi:outer membrane protein TolC